MKSLCTKTVKAQARLQTQQNGAAFRKILILHGAIYWGAMILMALLDPVSDALLENAVGLSGASTRAAIMTGVMALSLAISFAQPFWQTGMLHCATRAARGQAFCFSDALQGFRRFGPVLRFQILQTILLYMVLIAAMMLVSSLSCFIPVPQEVQALILEANPQTTEDMMLLIQQIPVEQLEMMMLPLILLFSVAACVFLIPLQYALRLCSYLLVDEQRSGAVAALVGSFAMMRGNKWRMFKLDLSMWWYSALQCVFLLILAFGSQLDAMGLLTVGAPGWLNLIATVVCAAGTVLLLALAGAYRETMFACAYDQLLTSAREGVAEAPRDSI